MRLDGIGPRVKDTVVRLRFSADPLRPFCHPARDQTASAVRWETFWKSGGAIDLSGSSDARWQELERRIVLSQYLMAAMSAGSWHLPRTAWWGLIPGTGVPHGDGWWHLATMPSGIVGNGGQGLGCYSALPAARDLARSSATRV